LRSCAHAARPENMRTITKAIYFISPDFNPLDVDVLLNIIRLYILEFFIIYKEFIQFN